MWVLSRVSRENSGDWKLCQNGSRVLTVMALQWGTQKFHMLCLRNLQIAQTYTGKTCAVMLESRGREIFVKTETYVDGNEISHYRRTLEAKANDKVTEPSPWRTKIPFLIHVLCDSATLSLKAMSLMCKYILKNIYSAVRHFVLHTLEKFKVHSKLYEYQIRRSFNKYTNSWTLQNL